MQQENKSSTTTATDRTTDEKEEAATTKTPVEDEHDDNDNEILRFVSTCPNCSSAKAETRVTTKRIPHVDEIILICLECNECGYIDRETKVGGGGGDSSAGNSNAKTTTTTTLTIQSPHDLQREVFVSETADISIKELEFESEGGGIVVDGGAYTTVEGLLKRIHNQVRLSLQQQQPSSDAAMLDDTDDDTNDANNSDIGTTVTSNTIKNPHRHQHSSSSFIAAASTTAGNDTNNKLYQNFLQNLHDISTGRIYPATLTLTDPSCNSFIGHIPPTTNDVPLAAELSTRQCNEEEEGCSRSWQ